MNSLRRIAAAGVVAAIALAIFLALFAALRGRPQDLPWTPLDLGQPVGMFTGTKLAALTRDFPKCRALLDQAGVSYTLMPPVNAGRCGYADGVRFAPGGSRLASYAPATTGTSCPIAAALSVWEWTVVQPAARRYFGQRVASIDHLGSYNCRNIYGRATGPLSEHATADAIDIAGFTLEDGTKITIIGDWADNGDKGTFLRSVRNGACRLFSTTLSPEYNAAHHDHLHLDEAERGTLSWRTCR
ncbi:extensin-like domain-containing protein [Sphingomonas alpina]|uniref:Extensin family protein n=1 Tax=Sphingomonas alpina TaxID=653931 RepID=A0A7H0LPX3_9SPHN|nr:extensin family protein [Sphingomonas alpina]QNQ11726.1 extensin family protein [Sphingomonas alpina]